MLSQYSLSWQGQSAICWPHLKVLFYLCWTYWTALVHVSCMLLANWQVLVWLHVTGLVVLDVDSGNPASPGGVLCSESSDSDCISSHLWGGTMCISKFQWTTWVYPTPCHSLMVCTGRFGCCSTTTYFMFFQWSHILCLAQNAFCQTRQRSPG